MGLYHLHNPEGHGYRRLGWAFAVNLLLTLAQVVGGLVSGSLSLIADALHNFSDAAALLIAWVARRIGRRPPDRLRTFGYQRAEVIAALINLTTLVLIGLYLIYAALWRLFEPQVIEGWTVIIVAIVALAVDVVTALLTHSLARHSLNLRAAFLHNVSDALASLGVILAGSLILLYGWYWSDTLLTLIIAGYVLYQAAGALPATVHLLMSGTPAHISVEEVSTLMRAIPEVREVHHIHLWQIDEHHNSLEAHVVIDDYERIDAVRNDLKQALEESFGIQHSTLEFERRPCADTHC